MVETFWPGQVERIDFDLAQLTAIASVARSEVFWAMNPREPMSAADVARSIGKSAQTVRYHINELLKVGLIIPVETRKRRSRIEEAYVFKAIKNYSLGPPFTPEYRQQMGRGLRAILRQIARERAANLAVQSIKPEISAYSTFRTRSIRLTPEQAVIAKKRLLDAVESLNEFDDSEGLRTSIAVYLSPALGESLAIYEAMTGHSLEEADDDTEE